MQCSRCGTRFEMPCMSPARTCEGQLVLPCPFEAECLDCSQHHRCPLLVQIRPFLPDETAYQAISA
jgi:hypothetical protein